MVADILTNVIVLLASLILLIITSQWVIENSIKIAHLARVSEVVIGFIFIAIATSIPELAVSVSAIMSADIGIAIGNLLGSNVADIALIVGIASFFGPVIIRRRLLREISTILFLTSLIPLILLNVRQSGRIVGFVLLIMFFLFVYYSMKRNLKLRMGRAPAEKIDHHFRAKIWVVTLLFFFLGIAGVFISSRFVVDSAVGIAFQLGIAEAVIGATIIAIGTSLPELAVDITAIRKGHWGLAFGDAIGSALTNLTLVLGMVLVVAGLPVDIRIFETLIMFLLATNMILWYFIGKGRLDRKEGIILLFVYQIFLMTIFGVQLVIL